MQARGARKRAAADVASLHCCTSAKRWCWLRARTGVALGGSLPQLGRAGGRLLFGPSRVEARTEGQLQHQGDRLGHAGGQATVCWERWSVRGWSGWRRQRGLVPMQARAPLLRCRRRLPARKAQVGSCQEASVSGSQKLPARTARAPGAVARAWQWAVRALGWHEATAAAPERSPPASAVICWLLPGDRRFRPTDLLAATIALFQQPERSGSASSRPNQSQLRHELRHRACPGLHGAQCICCLHLWLSTRCLHAAERSKHKPYPGLAPLQALPARPLAVSATTSRRCALNPRRVHALLPQPPPPPPSSGQSAASGAPVPRARNRRSVQPPL